MYSNCRENYVTHVFTRGRPAQKTDTLNRQEVDC
jgi:hypothetical protein